MKIIKVSDTQIRCTIEGGDLATHKLKISDIAYGSEKAKNLLQEIMEQADKEVGFKAEDIPLMIEAVPNPDASITLIITKVDNPEALDTHFAEHNNAAKQFINPMAEKLEGAETYKLNSAKKTQSSKKTPMKLISFYSLDHVIRASKLIAPFYTGLNTLYKDEPNELYILVVTKGKHSNLEYSRICNMLSEFGTLEISNGISLAYLEEHCKVICDANAIEKLSKL